MGKRELQIKGNGGKLGLSREECVHMNCSMFQGKKYGPVNLSFNPLNARAVPCWPECRCLGLGEAALLRGANRLLAVRCWQKWGVIIQAALFEMEA